MMLTYWARTMAQPLVGRYFRQWLAFLFLIASLAACNSNLHYGNCTSDSACANTKTDQCLLVDPGSICSLPCNNFGNCPGAAEGKAWCMNRTNGTPICVLRCTGDADCYQGQVCQTVAGQGGGCVPEGSKKQIPKRDSAPPPPPKKDIGTPPKRDTTVAPLPDKSPTGCPTICATGNWVFKIPTAKGTGSWGNPVTLSATLSCSSSKSSLDSSYPSWDGTCQAKTVGGDFGLCTSNTPKKFRMKIMCSTSRIYSGNISFCVRHNNSDITLSSDHLVGTLASSTITGNLTLSGLTYKFPTKAPFTAMCQ